MDKRNRFPIYDKYEESDPNIHSTHELELDDETNKLIESKGKSKNDDKYKSDDNCNDKDRDDDVNKFISDNRLYLDKFYQNNKVNSMIKDNIDFNEDVMNNLKRLKESEFYSSNHMTKSYNKFRKNFNEHEEVDNNDANYIENNYNNDLYCEVNEINVNDIYRKYLGNYYDDNNNESNDKNNNDNDNNNDNYKSKYLKQIKDQESAHSDYYKVSDSNSKNSSTPQEMNSDCSHTGKDCIHYKDNNEDSNSNSNEFYKIYGYNDYEDLSINNANSNVNEYIKNKVSDLDMKNQSINDIDLTVNRFYSNFKVEGSDRFDNMCKINNLQMSKMNNNINLKHGLISYTEDEILNRNNSDNIKQSQHMHMNMHMNQHYMKEDYIMKLELAKLINQSINKKSPDEETIIEDDIKFDSDVCLIDRAFSNESSEMKITNSKEFKFVSLAEINKALEEESVENNIKEDKKKEIYKDIDNMIVMKFDDNKNNAHPHKDHKNDMQIYFKQNVDKDEFNSSKYFPITSDINERLIDYSMRNSLNTLISSVDLLNEFNSLEAVSKNEILENIIKNSLKYDNIDYYISSLLSGDISSENLSLLRFIPNLSRYKKAINFDDICDILMFETNQEKSRQKRDKILISEQKMVFFTKNNFLNKHLSKDKRSFNLSSEKINKILGVAVDKDNSTNYETDENSNDCNEIIEIKKSITNSISRIPGLKDANKLLNLATMKEMESNINIENETEYINFPNKSSYNQYIQPMKKSKPSIFDKLKSGVSGISGVSSTKINIDLNLDESMKNNLNSELEIEDLCKEKNDNNNIIKLNVGGKKIVTFKKIFERYPDSSLYDFVTKKEKVLNKNEIKSNSISNTNTNMNMNAVKNKKNEYYFLDRDPHIFYYVITFLRNGGKLPIFRSSTEEILFFEEIEFWGINFKKTDTDIYSLLKFDKNWCANTLSLDDNGSVVNKHNSTHGIVFTKLCLNQQHSYVEFKVEMKIPSSGSSHLFIGVLDKSKYSIDHLTSSFWKDSPSSFYWDVWSNKLIKTDENGIQIGTKNNYGCLCENELVKPTYIGVRYNVETKSISFYKNNINQGVAFTNVPENLTVSLDIWFEYGSVEIMRTNKENVFI